MKQRFYPLIGLLLFCAACATFSVSYDFDPEADFTVMKTYGWKPIPEKKQVNEITLKRIKLAVAQQLQAKGFSQSSDNPDMLIALHVGKQKKVDTQEWGYQYGDVDSFVNVAPSRRFIFVQPPAREYSEYRRGIDTYEYEEGTLVLDFVDAKKKTLIWRGTATSVIDPQKPGEQINEIVAKMLENFPPGKKK